MAKQPKHPHSRHHQPAAHDENRGQVQSPTISEMSDPMDQKKLNDEMASKMKDPRIAEAIAGLRNSSASPTEKADQLAEAIQWMGPTVARKLTGRMVVAIYSPEVTDAMNASHHEPVAPAPTPAQIAAHWAAKDKNQQR